MPACGAASAAFRIAPAIAETYSDTYSDTYTAARKIPAGISAGWLSRVPGRSLAWRSGACLSRPNATHVSIPWVGHRVAIVFG
jgi:hypothetical protein